MRYLTNELAKLLGVTTNTIRRYEDSNFLKPKRDSSNYRYYEEYDISKAAIIRLYIKCGFSHDEIRAMLDKDTFEIQSIYQSKLDNIDFHLERLKRLRHWLKDNLQLMNTVNELRDKFYIMNCTALKYVVFKDNDNILKEKERLNIINYFMYEAPEVQLMQIFKLENLENNEFLPQTIWAVKEKDIEKFNMTDIINTNKYVKTYPSVKCLFGVIEISSADIYDINKFNLLRKEFLLKAKKYTDDNNYSISGDIIEILVNALGNKISILVCIPISDK